MKLSLSRTLLSVGVMAVGTSLMVTFGVASLLGIGAAVLMDEALGNLKNRTLDSDINLIVNSGQKPSQTSLATPEPSTDQAIASYRDRIAHEREHAKPSAKSF